jgi:twinkle protein
MGFLAENFMKIQSNITKLIYSIDFDESKPKERYKCPEPSCCQSDRKNPKDLQYYPKTKTAYCHKCQASFFEFKVHESKPNYILPEWKNITKLTDKLVKWFTGRLISQNTLVKMKIYSDNSFMPQFNKEIEVICFPYFADGKLINIKFRGANKSFKLFPNAELIWYNIDALKNNKEIIICEGEIDALSWIECGFDNVISVPNGANNRLEYLDNTIELFEKIDKVYLATDNDGPGINLRDELVRRLGPEKCNIINFKEYKDSNDYLQVYGQLEFKKLIQESKPIPVKGIVEINTLYHEIIELYKNGSKQGLPIGNNSIDEFINWELGRLLIVTGIPGSGKSEFVDYLVCRLNLLYNWKAAYFTPESYPLKYHYRNLHEKFSGKKFNAKTDTTDFDSIYDYIKDNFFYIMDENDLTIDTIMKSAKFLVKQKGIKILVIDPYNKVDHQYNYKISETQYISKFLDILINFARFNNILVILVAHPTKMQKNEIPTLYNISGSAHFYNKTDYGITVHRITDENGSMTNEVEIYIQKVKIKYLGYQGMAEQNYNYNNGRFECKNSDVNNWDNSNWLIPIPNESLRIENFDFVESNEIPF